MTVTIVKPCHISAVKRAVGDVVEVTGDLGARLIAAGYAKSGSAPVVETAVAPPPEPERAVAPPSRRSRRA